MLVLSRKYGEEISITHGADTIVIKVCETKNGCTKLGIEAPHDYKILRKELTDASR